MTTPLPAGLAVAIDPSTRQLDGTTLLGGTPLHALRLSARGARAWQHLRQGRIDDRADGVLARRLTDIGAAHPRPAEDSLDVTVVIPVRDRASELVRCLTALAGRYPVVVVDDGSRDPHATAQVANRHGAALVRRRVNGGPAAARNIGLAVVDTEFVAFVDSDCMPPERWVERLAGHFADPLVAAVAPRIVAGEGAGRYARAYGALDLGPQESRVLPGGRVGYVPTAALLVRRAALAGLGGAAFDPALRVGEDVDLIWRLHEAGWRIRYDPSVLVAHREPRTRRAILARRFRYGTSAADLAERHPAAMRHIVLNTGPAATVAAVLARRPAAAAVAFGIHTALVHRSVRRAGLPATGVLPANLRGLARTWVGLGRFACQFGSPLLVLGGTLPGSAGRRLLIGSLLLAPAFVPACAPLPVTTRVPARLADDLAYGAGVWAGCLRRRSFRALVPQLSRQPFRLGTERPSP